MSKHNLSQACEHLRVWAEVDLVALRYNVAYLQSQSSCGESKLAVMAVIKADAYGHGITDVAKCLEEANIDFFGVAHMAEAQILAEQGIKTRIYLLGATLPDERKQIVTHAWTPCICSLAEAEHFNKLSQEQGKQLKVHIAIDTGMGRGGFLPQQLLEVGAALQKLEYLDYEGVSSHFCASDEDARFTHVQIERYKQAVRVLENQLNCDFIYQHLANTAGVLDYQIPHCNLIRPGLGLYGIAVGKTGGHDTVLRPVMSLKSKISLIREMPKGSSLSYGRDYITPRKMLVATVCIGYGDGYPRAVNQHKQQAQVWVDGQLCNVLGRVTMDQILVDISHVPQAYIGLEVELFGVNLSINQLSQWAHTIPWEVFTQITPRVKRVFKDTKG